MPGYCQTSIMAPISEESYGGTVLLGDADQGTSRVGFGTLLSSSRLGIPPMRRKLFLGNRADNWLTRKGL